MSGICSRHGAYSSAGRCPICAAETQTQEQQQVTWTYRDYPWWYYPYPPAPQPPPVCTGSGHPPDLMPTSRDGRCGICKRIVGLTKDDRCVTHPYEPGERKP